MANPIVILYENFADTAVISGGSWLSALPLSNLQDSDIRRVARSSNAAIASTTFSIDLGRTQPIGGIAFGPSNLSPGATWRARGYDQSAVLRYDSGIQAVLGGIIDWTDANQWLEWEDPGFWLGISEFATFNELPQFPYHIVPAASEGAASLARIWNIEIFDASNGDGHVDIGRLVFGRAFRPSFNYSQDNELSIAPLTDTEESLGGFRAYWERGLRRTFRCAFPNMQESELFDDVFRMMLRSGISRQVFVVPDPADTTQIGGRRSFLATFKQIPTMQQLLVDRGSTAFDLEEVL